jgi:predicted permease
MSWWRRLFSRSRLESELDAELRDHVDRMTADLEAGGASQAEARRRALASLGGLDPVKEYCRDARGTRWVEDTLQDVRYAIRALSRAPGFAVVAVLSLALGIGANTAIFSLVNTLLLRTTPVSDPDRLVRIDKGSWTNPIWEQLRDHHADICQGMAAYSGDQFNISPSGQAEPVQTLWTSGAFFDVMGVPAILGRTYTAEDDRRGGGPNGPVAVISYAFWQRHFGGAADVIGRSVTANRVTLTIVGVTPPGFLGPDLGRSFDIAVPFGVEPVMRGKESWLDRRSTWWLEIVARMKPGQTPADVERGLNAARPQVRDATLPERWPPEYLKDYLKDAWTVVPQGSGASNIRSRFREPLFTLMATVGFVLLIACANIANLSLARATARRHEMSLRRALGASRLRLARALLVESLLLSGAGAALGLLFARWASELLVSQLSTFRDSVVLDLRLDWRVLIFTAAVAVGTALLFGLVPALRASGAEPAEALTELGRGGASLTRRLGNPLIVAQVALSVMLLVGAGLFVRTFMSLASLDLGFDRDPLLIVMMDAQQSTVPSSGRHQLSVRVRDAVATLPGVERVAVSMLTPLSNMMWNDAVEVEGQPALKGRERMAYFNAITPGWFATYGTPLVAGRDFDSRDRNGATPVAIVNQAFAHKFAPGVNPIGKVIRLPDHDVGQPTKTLEIIGVAANSAYTDMRNITEPVVYTCYMQSSDESEPFSALTVRVAKSQAPALLVRSLVTRIGTVDRDMSLSFHTFSEQVNAGLVRERIMALLSGFFGGLALLLAGIGLYGVASYTVNLRRTEIGVRMALGADAARVQRMVVSRMARLVAIGVVVGAAASFWASRFVAALLYGLEPGDPLTIAGAALVLTTIALLAAWLPARRAARIDPSVVLREG